MTQITQITQQEMTKNITELWNSKMKFLIGNDSIYYYIINYLQQNRGIDIDIIHIIFYYIDFDELYFNQLITIIYNIFHTNNQYITNNFKIKLLINMSVLHYKNFPSFLYSNCYRNNNYDKNFNNYMNIVRDNTFGSLRLKQSTYLDNVYIIIYNYLVSIKYIEECFITKSTENPEEYIKKNLNEILLTNNIIKY